MPLISAGARVVDLSSSWPSRLLAALKGRLACCVSYGLNGCQMEFNSHLTGFWVPDLNMRALIPTELVNDHSPEDPIRRFCDASSLPGAQW